MSSDVPEVAEEEVADRRGATSDLSTAIVLGVLFGLTALGSAAIAVVAPSLAGELELSTSGIASIFVAFGLAFAAATAIYGRLADIRGERGRLVFTKPDSISQRVTALCLTTTRYHQGGRTYRALLLYLWVVWRG